MSSASARLNNLLRGLFFKNMKFFYVCTTSRELRYAIHDRLHAYTAHRCTAQLRAVHATHLIATALYYVRREIITTIYVVCHIIMHLNVLSCKPTYSGKYDHVNPRHALTRRAYWLWLHTSSHQRLANASRSTLARELDLSLSRYLLPYFHLPRRMRMHHMMPLSSQP